MNKKKNLTLTGITKAFEKLTLSELGQKVYRLSKQQNLPQPLVSAFDLAKIEHDQYPSLTSEREKLSTMLHGSGFLEAAQNIFDTIAPTIISNMRDELKQNPDNFAARIRLGRALLSSDPQEAASHLHQAIEGSEAKGMENYKLYGYATTARKWLNTIPRDGETPTNDRSL